MIEKRQPSGRSFRLDSEVAIFGFHRFRGWKQHSTANSRVRAQFNQHKGAGEAISSIAVVNERLGNSKAYLSDTVHGQTVSDGLRFEVLDVNTVLDACYESLHRLSGVLEKVFDTTL